MNYYNLKAKAKKCYYEKYEKFKYVIHTYKGLLAEACTITIVKYVSIFAYQLFCKIMVIVNM